MSVQLYVKTCEGRAPRHETTHQPLLPQGDYWPDNVYTRRRLRDGDIELASAPAAIEPPLAAISDTEVTSIAGKKSTSKRAEQ